MAESSTNILSPTILNLTEMKASLSVIFSLLCLGQALMASSLEQIGFAIEGKARQARIEATIVNNLVVVELTVNKFVKLNFILDSGVQDAILLDPIIANVLPIDPVRTITLRGLGNEEEIEANIATDLEMDLGPISGKNLEMIVVPEAIDLDAYLGMKVHGLIGYDLFKRFQVKIDYHNEAVTFYEPSFWKSAPKRYRSNEIEILDSKAYLRMDLKEENEAFDDRLFLVDTGASIGLSFNVFSEKAIHKVEPNLRAQLGKGLSGGLDGHIGRIDEVAFSGTVFNEVIAAFPRKESIRFLSEFDHAGSVGGEILRRFTVIFDYPNSKIHFRKSRNVREAFVFNNTGMQLCAAGTELEMVKVEGIIPDSSADQCGIRAEDEIISINGIAGKEISLENIQRQLDGMKDGKVLRMRIKRDGEVLKKKLQLESVI